MESGQYFQELLFGEIILTLKMKNTVFCIKGQWTALWSCAKLNKSYFGLSRKENIQTNDWAVVSRLSILHLLSYSSNSPNQVLNIEPNSFGINTDILSETMKQTHS